MPNLDGEESVRGSRRAPGGLLDDLFQDEWD